MPLGVIILDLEPCFTEGKSQFAPLIPGRLQYVIALRATPAPMLRLELGLALPLVAAQLVGSSIAARLEVSSLVARLEASPSWQAFVTRLEASPTWQSGAARLGVGLEASRAWLIAAFISAFMALQREQRDEGIPGMAWVTRPLTVRIALEAAQKSVMVFLDGRSEWARRMNPSSLWRKSFLLWERFIA